jgi:hypothetical protein
MYGWSYDGSTYVYAQWQRIVVRIHLTSITKVQDTAFQVGTAARPDMRSLDR